MKKISEFLDKYQNIIILIIGVLAVYLISVFPPSGDDFNRLTESFTGLEDWWQRVKRLYNSLNGRVVGNEISYLFINRVPRTIIKAISVFLYIVMMMKVLNIKRLSGLLIIVGSIILMPLAIFRQTLVWSAGFYNYFPPMVLILSLIYIFIYHRNEFSHFQYLAIFLISLVTSLFLENLTIYMVLFPLVMAICFWNKDNKKAYLTSFIGALIGGLIMFSSPVYREVGAGEDGYRTIATHILSFVSENWQIFSEYMLVYNVFIVALFIGALLLGTFKAYKKKKISVQPLALIVLVGLVPFSLIDLGMAGSLISMGLHILFYLLLIFIALKEYKFDNYNSRLILFSSLSIAITMGPLLLVSPVSARNFLSPIVFNVLIIISLLRLNGIPDHLEVLGSRILTIVMALVFIAYIFAYTVNYNTFLQRDEILRGAIEEDREEAFIPKYPFESFNGGYGTDSMGNFYYKEEKKDLRINIVD